MYDAVRLKLPELLERRSEVQALTRAAAVARMGVRFSGATQLSMRDFLPAAKT